MGVRDFVYAWGAWIDGNENEVFKRWNPQGVSYICVLTVANYGTCTLLEEIPCIENTFQKLGARRWNTS